MNRPEAIHVGDFVYCGSRYYRDQLQLPRELGLVIEIKRNNLKVLYSNDKRCWLPRETVVRMKPELTYETFAERLYYLIKRAHALDCELVSNGDMHRLTLRIDRIDVDAIDDLRRFLGDSFLSLTILPEGMAFMQAEIQFRY